MSIDLKPLIWSILKSVFRQFQLVRCAYESLRCLDLQTTGTTNYFTPRCAHEFVLHHLIASYLLNDVQEG